MIGMLISLVIFCVVIYVLYLLGTWLLAMAPFPQPIKTAILCIVGLILLIWFLDFIGVYHTGWNWRGVR